VIRHRPFGSGHPYDATGDQRVPSRPEHGQACELRVRARDDVVKVAIEWQEGVTERSKARSVFLPMEAPRDPLDGTVTSGGHLAEAQAEGLADRRYWSGTTPVLERGCRYRYRFRSRDAAGRTRTSRWYELSVPAWETLGGELEVVGRAAVLEESVRWLTDDEAIHQVAFALELLPGDHVIGFGERYDSVDQRGRRLDATVFEQYQRQGEHGRTYLPMPFALVIGADRTWGFHVRTSRRTWFDVGATDPGRLEVTAEMGGDKRLEVAVYDGTPDQVIAAFLDEVGAPELLPDWVLRLWASGNEWNTQQLVMERMDTHSDLDIPVGAVVIEAWSDELTFTAFRDARYEPTDDGAPHRLADFTFPPDGAWPDPRGMVEALHDRGIKVILWQIPLLKTKPADGQLGADCRAAEAGAHLVREEDCTPYRNRGWWFPRALMPDFTAARTRDWWTSKRRYLVDEVGVDGFKTDGGEHAWGHELRYADGTRGDESNNLFPVEYARAFGDLLRSCGKAPVTFSRAGFSGSQAHGAFWAGDESSTWQAFQASIRAGISASACGIVYWGWDLAGFSGDVPDPELYLRAAAASTFLPVMQYHSEFHHHRLPLRDRTPWNVADVHGEPSVVDVFRRFAHLRERLVGYLHGQAALAVERRTALMRGLFLDHADDPAVWDWPAEFLIGRDLLVHPVLEPGRTEWTTYLPAGDWVDVWTGEPVAGRQVHRRPVPLTEVPVYARADAWPGLGEAFRDLPTTS
jgi:alpha-glucosidase (family GH31 glycosyl hydrolase)